MSTGRTRSRMVSAILVCLLPLCMSPAFGEAGGAALTGVVLDAGSRAPLAGVQVHVADPAGDRFYVSEPTDQEGTFQVAGLPAATYEIGLEHGDGLYLVQHPVLLAPGQNHLVEVTLDIKGEDEEEDTRGATFWQNPLTAALLVTGSAVLIGLLLEKAVEDSDPVQSPSVPLN